MSKEQETEIVRLKNIISRISDIEVNPPAFILDDAGVLNRLNDYIDKTKRPTKHGLRKILRGLVKRL